MKHRSYINKIIVTFVLVSSQVVDATLRASEEKREIRIHLSSKACSSINISMKDGHIELRYPVSVADNYFKIYNCWVQQPIFLPGCPVWPSLWFSALLRCQNDLLKRTRLPRLQIFSAVSAWLSQHSEWYWVANLEPPVLAWPSKLYNTVLPLKIEFSLSALLCNATSLAYL